MTTPCPCGYTLTAHVHWTPPPAPIALTEDTPMMTTETRSVCAGCTARHHERCNGWTTTYVDRGDGALALLPCACVKCQWHYPVPNVALPTS